MAIRLFDSQTGEVFDAELTLKKGGSRFMKLWQKTGLTDKVDNLQGNSLRILIRLADMAGYNNLIPTASELARKLNKTTSVVTRAYLELAKNGFLVKLEGHYFLSPYYCWKGTQKDYEVMREKVNKDG